jgi:hypothetical protein
MLHWTDGWGGSTLVDVLARSISRTARVATEAVRPHWLRRLAKRLAAVLADDGTSARFAAERQRDDDLVRRVERRRRL